jgi:hypothetical protein
MNDQEFKRMMERKAKKIEQRPRIDEEVGKKLRAMEPWKLE